MTLYKYAEFIVRMLVRLFKVALMFMYNYYITPEVIVLVCISCYSNVILCILAMLTYTRVILRV